MSKSCWTVAYDGVMLLSVRMTHCGDIVEAGVLDDLTHFLHVHIQVSDVVIPDSAAVILESDVVISHTARTTLTHWSS